MSGPNLSDLDEFDVETDDFVHPFQAKERTYLHFDLPLPKRLRQSAHHLLDGKNHRFFPLLGFTDVKRRVTVERDGRVSVTEKPRPIRYASHNDAAFLEAYSHQLGLKYEAALVSRELNTSVLAYRPNIGSNVHHAKSLFDEIRALKDCTVVALDISGFFYSIDHEILKREVCSLLRTGVLSGTDWNVFRNVTRYSWVDTGDIDLILGKSRNRPGRICSPDDFRDYVRSTKRGLIQRHSDNFGIPQGTPISGLYANISMLSLDAELLQWAGRLGGSYRRYSDDIAIVLPGNAKPSDIEYSVGKILADFGLTLSEGKTDHSIFSNLVPDQGRPIQYLGFTFDGSNIFIRDSSIKAYQKKMEKGIRAKLTAANRQGIPSSQVYRRELYSRYTHLGFRRSFPRYAYAASDILKAPEIRRQLRRHVEWFKRAWERQVEKVYGDLSSVESK